nr:H-NS histone family protein [Halochromatium glycolicum]
MKNQIEQTKQREAELQRALDHRWQAEKTELAQEIRGMIEDRGYDVEEIMNHVLPRRRRGPGAKKGSSGNYTRYVDPENPDRVYTRGVLPGWMKEKMAAVGLDPGSKEDRETFKANHLQAVQD